MTFYITKFDPSTSYHEFNNFDCGHKNINSFVKNSLKKQVKQQLSMAYVFLEETPIISNRFVGFFTIASHSIPLTLISSLQLGSLPKIIPCIRLIMLGVNLNDAKSGIGLKLMNHVFDLTKMAAHTIGVYGLYLDADAGAIDFYTKLGFTLLEGDRSPDPSPMFIQLSRIP